MVDKEDNKFCSNYDICKTVFKCCSITDNTVYVFLNIYFLENDFKKGDKVTWLNGGNKKERLYGSVISVNPKNNKLKVKGDNKKTYPGINSETVNRLHDFDEVISKILDNIQKNKNPYENINEEKLERLKKYICGKDIVEELLPLAKEGFEHIFVYDEMIYLDDTCSTVLKKLSQYCSNIDYEDYKYIYASYFNIDDENIPLGFKYKESTTLHPNDILNKKLCDIFEIEKDDDSSTIIEKEYETILENHYIKNNCIYFINLNDFIDKHELNTVDFKKCGEDEHEIVTFKNEVINKYWPLLVNEKLSDIIDKNDDKQKSYDDEKDKLYQYSVFNKIINSNIEPDEDEDDTPPCDAYIKYFKTTKRQSKNITIDLYKLFTDVRLNERVPFVKWVTSSNENKYYKLYKDSIIYEGYGDFEVKGKNINFKTCQEWIKDFYRSKKKSLEKINRFDIIHKDDIISFKIFHGKMYATLSISIDGTLDFIIKKEDESKGISSKSQIIHLLKFSNEFIKQINENKLFEHTLDDFGNDEEIEDIFINNNGVDFIDAVISYKKDNYEVLQGNGIENEDEKEKGKGNELIPPFSVGKKTNLFIPILRKVFNNLPMFFRYMNEDDNENIPENVIGLQYNRSNNFTNINTIQSLITVYLNKEIYQEENKIINDITRVFNIDSKTVKDEITSIKEIEREREKYRKVLVVDEDTPNITVSLKTNYLEFEIRNMKSFMEFQRITALTKVIMMLFKKYINNDIIFQGDNYINSLFTEDKLNVKSKIIQEEKVEGKYTDGAAYLNMDNDSDTTSSSSEYSSSDSNLSSLEKSEDSMSEVDGGGQRGGAKLRSYYLKRLKGNDKKLFSPDQPWTVKQKNGSHYGYAKQCADNLDRKPISITTEQLKEINEGKDKSISGPESYSKAINVPRRSKDIWYICPQYWDIEKEIPLRKEYVEKHKDKLIKDKENKDNGTILERKGKYWDGIPDENSKDHILPGFSKLIIHPDGYKLPCCFSKRGLEKEDIPSDDEEEDVEFEERVEVEEDVEVEEEVIVKKPEKSNVMCKINTKESLPISVGQCSQLPKKLKILLSQDKIFEYDPNLSISNGFIRKGVKQSESMFIFKESSFINSFIELVDYNGNSRKFINDELIKPLISDINYYQLCPSLHKLFRKKNITADDKKDIYTNYLIKNKKLRESLWGVFGKDNIQKIITIFKKDDSSITSNIIGYIYSLIVSLKTYIDFLRSDEEKKDEYIIPVLNSIQEDKINVVIFEKEGAQIKTKDTEQIDTDNYCFIIKEGSYYEPIIYRVNLLKNQYEIKILSKRTFSSFDVFERTIFNKFLTSPYPRGRKENEKLNCTGTSKKQKYARYCSEWIEFKDYSDKIPKETSLRWIDNSVEGCPNSGVKNYDEFEKEKNGIIVTKTGKKVSADIVYIKIKKQVNPRLKENLEDKTKWVWIDRDCGEIHDKDIESLIRKKYDKDGNDKLLEYSTKNISTIKKLTNDEVLEAMKSHFFLINRTLDDLEKIKEKKDIEYHDIESVDKKHYINNYSEITHIIYKTSDEDILLPIQPVKMSPLYIGIDIVYEITNYPKFMDVLKYLDNLDIELKKIIVNSNDEITCLFLNDGMIPVQKEKIDLDRYDIIKSEINPFEVDKEIMIKKQLPEKYIDTFKQDNKYKNKLFAKLLNIIKDDETVETTIMGIYNDPVFIKKHKVEKIFTVFRKYVIKKINPPTEEFPVISKKLLQEFCFKLIINLEGGETIPTINKVIDDVVRFSDLEKSTPDKEVFIKYIRDKEQMNNNLMDIFVKKSVFINIKNEKTYTDEHILKTTKLKTTPFYINKLFGQEASIIFNIDGNGLDWYNLSRALSSIDIKPSHYANEITKIKGVIEGPRRKIKHIGHIERIILYKLSTLNESSDEDKKEYFIKSYNKYNILRYGEKKHKIFTSIDDIMKYWRIEEGDIQNQRINKPDIELIIEKIQEENVEDFGVLLISFSNGKEMNIKFYGTENINSNTKVVLLHHTLYNNDYVLSNIIVDGKYYLTIDELFNASDHHKKWIDEEKVMSNDALLTDEEELKKDFHRERKEYHYDKAKYHEEKENQ